MAHKAKGPKPLDLGEGTTHKPRRNHPHLATEFQEKGDAGSAHDVARNLRRWALHVLIVPRQPDQPYHQEETS